jgi:DNA-binding NtrC family response regulator
VGREPRGRRDRPLPGIRRHPSKGPEVAAFREPVLVTGESGVGKESIAQAIYLLSDARGKPFVSVNCPQHREGNLTVSELFGHTKGSFTGAVADRKGALEEAHGGVIFLDEIADLHLDAQAMLLRTLASGEFKPIGSSTSRTADVRVVAATNRPLEKLMLAEEFRNDLFFRLRYFLLKIPPLRERGDDWYLLSRHFLSKMKSRYGVDKGFSQESLRTLEQYDWPGNVRQLWSVVTMGYAMADGDVIEPPDFAPQIEFAGQEAPCSIDTVYRRVVADGEGFWEAVHRPFLDRELNRREVRAVIGRGLAAVRGSYRDLLDLFHMPSTDYQRLMDFLRHHQLKP